MIHWKFKCSIHFIPHPILTRYNNIILYAHLLTIPVQVWQKMNKVYTGNYDL